MADHSASPGTSHESEASEASVFCFDNTSPEKSCFNIMFVIDELSTNCTSQSTNNA